MNDKITIEDLEVRFHVGVPDEERTEAQKLLITIEIFKELSSSAKNDDLSNTIDYFSVTQEIKALGENQSWKLIETLASDICELVISNFKAESVRVIVKKFILPDTRWVSVDITRKI
ncbi:MAG: dihydroneopterin aldolase [Verrucomicrobiota bacterium]|jgi:dihydroneopterin aldolase|nr:dihydroneopterin aldolase [Verrucomicrobiota bacterium]MEE2615389.1 dihydroneopterin aldolase [Verrucomicrobiota bacterium]